MIQLINPNFENNRGSVPFRKIYRVAFKSESKTQQESEINTEPKTEKKIGVKVALSTFVGTILPMLVIRKYQKKSIDFKAMKNMDLWSKTKNVLKSFNIKYGLKEMLFVNVGAVMGGLTGGFIFDKKERQKPKTKEAIFQLANVAIPTTMAAKLIERCEKTPKLNKPLPKVASVIFALGCGIPIAMKVSNTINNKIVDPENPNVRKFKLKDMFVHVDDFAGALVLAKIPFADKLHAEKFLPVLYSMCGYEVGIDKD